MDYIDSASRGAHPPQSPRLFVFDEHLQLIAESHDEAQRLSEHVKNAVRDTVRAWGEQRHRIEQTAMITPTLSIRIVDLEGATSHCTAVVLQEVGKGTGSDS